MKNAVKPFLQRALGFKLYLTAHSIFVANTMRLRPQEGEVLTFIAMLKPDDTVLDIGANVGAMMLLFSRACPKGSVNGFEPIPDNFQAASSVLTLFRTKNTTLFPLGVGERRSTVHMVMPAAHAVRYEALIHVVRENENPEGQRYDVTLVALDDEILPKMRVNAMKIDVKDHERFVLRGAVELIRRDRPIIYCELWSDENKAECFRIVRELDYTVMVAIAGN